MKKAAIAVASVLTMGLPALAQDYYWSSPRDNYSSAREYREYRGDTRRDFARVIESRPVYAANAKQECWNPRAGVYEEVREENKTRIGKGAAVGAVAGGVLGHQVDQGGGTAAGAILGGILGHQLERRQNRNEQDDLDFNRCRVMAGYEGSGGVQQYEVRYEYDGREYVTYMPNQPGRRLRLGEDIRPDGSPYDNVALNEYGR